MLDDAPHDLQAVVAAVERTRRFVALHVDGEESPFSSRHVRRHCGHDIDDGRLVHRRGQVTDDRTHTVARRAPRRAQIDVDPDDERIRTAVLQPRRDRATTRAQIHRHATRREHAGCAPSQILGLHTRDVDTGIDAQHEPAELDAPGDPGQRFADLAATQTGVELGRIGRVGEQLTRFVLRCDAPRRRESCGDVGQAGNGML